MRVLIVAFDLFRSVGGGQTFYRSVIEKHPAIRFFYLQDREPADAPRPANATPLRHVEHYGHHSLAGFAEPDVPYWAVHEFLAANNVARAAAAAAGGFDVIDTPDYERMGMFLPGALRRHGVGGGRVVVSMHGAVSTTMANTWGASGRKPITTVSLERLQYAAADGRYCISPAYRDEWAGYSPLPAHYLDPMWFFAPPPRKPYRPTPGPPALLFVGRTDKGKGPHLFVQLAWWLPPDSYREAVLVGPPVVTASGRTSSDLLLEMAAARRIGDRVRVEPAKTPAELADLYATNVLPVISSQHDTLNLVALEALFAGCPAVISSGAGAARYLRERFPQVPFVPFHLERFYANPPAVEDALRRYDDHRAGVAAALGGVDFTPSTPPLTAVYDAAPRFDAAARAEAERMERRMGERLTGV